MGRSRGSKRRCWNSPKETPRATGRKEPSTAPFPPGRGGGEGVERGYKGKGVLMHVVVEGHGLPLSVRVSPANGDERREAILALDLYWVSSNVTP